MPRDRTTVTELATALGTSGVDSLDRALAQRPGAVRLEPGDWELLAELHRVGRFAGDFATAFDIGRDFLAARDGLGGRPPRLIEWTGARRPPGDEVAPIDLRIDHVFLISCKYLSQNIQSPSPARLFDGLLATSGTWDRGDWYEATAPAEYQALYAACRAEAGRPGLPVRASDMSIEDRRSLRAGLPARRYPAGALDAYRALCTTVSRRSAERWRARLADADPEVVLWRLLRIGNAPYFVLGADGSDRVALRVDTPWDWRRRFRFRRLDVEPADAGQPQVNWTAHYGDRETGQPGAVEGHVEIRWSHGKFRQPPEAKVYVDTPVAQIPGYHPLGTDGAGAPGQLPLFTG